MRSSGTRRSSKNDDRAPLLGPINVIGMLADGGNVVHKEGDIQQHVEVNCNQESEKKRDPKWCKRPKRTSQWSKNMFCRKLNDKSWAESSDERVLRYGDMNSERIIIHPEMKEGIHFHEIDYLKKCGPKTNERTTLLNFHDLVKVIESSKGQRFALVGKAGAGKTVLLNRLSRNIQSRNGLNKTKNIPKKLLKKFTKKFDVVYLLNIQSNLRDNATPAEVLFPPGMTELEVKEIRHGFKSIVKGKTKMLMIIDGLHQGLFDFNFKNIPEIENWEEATASRIFGNLLSGCLLPNVTIIFSLRENFFTSFREDTPTTVETIAMVGFSEDDAREYIIHSLDENDRNKWETMCDTNPRLFRMACEIPLFLAFMIKIIKKDLAPPDSMSAMMTKIIEILVRKNDSTRAQFSENLKRLAFELTKEHRTTFTHKVCEEYRLSIDKSSDIIIEVPGSNPYGEGIAKSDLRYYFGHELLREILAAYHISEQKLDKFKEIVQEHINQPVWIEVRRLLCGILGNQRWEILEDISNPCDIKEKLGILMQTMIDKLENNCGPDEKLNIFVAFKEANDIETLRQYANFANVRMTSSRVATLCSILQELEESDELILQNCGLDKECINALASNKFDFQFKTTTCNLKENQSLPPSPVLWKTVFTKVKITHIEIDGNTFSEVQLLGFIKVCIEFNVERMTIGKAELSVAEFQEITALNILLEFDRLELRNAGGSNFDRSCAEIVSQCMRNIRIKHFGLDRYDQIWKPVIEASVECNTETFEAKTAVIKAEEMTYLEHRSFTIKFEELHILYETHSHSEKAGACAKKWNFNKIVFNGRDSLNFVTGFMKGYKSGKITTMTLKQHGPSYLEKKTTEDRNDEGNAIQKSLHMYLDQKYLVDNPRQFGKLFKNLAVEELVLPNGLPSAADDKSDPRKRNRLYLDFAAGLSGFKIGCVAVKQSSRDDIVCLLDLFKMEKLCVPKLTVGVKELKVSTVELLSSDEWLRRYPED